MKKAAWRKATAVFGRGSPVDNSGAGAKLGERRFPTGNEVRLVRGPDLVDRVISLDAALVALMGAIGVRVADSGDTLYIGILVVIAIVAFTATVVLSRFVETTGRR